MLIDLQSTNDTIDAVTDALDLLIEKTKCTLDVIQNMIDGTGLSDVYENFRAEFEAILQSDMKQCMEINGLIQKLK